MTNPEFAVAIVVVFVISYLSGFFIGRNSK